MTTSSLTIIIPTRNRPSYCKNLLQFLRSNGVTHSIVVLDSSDTDQAGETRAVSVDLALYQHLSSDVALFDKLHGLVHSVKSRYVALIPDDDITFPHAIERSLGYLQGHADCGVCHGYYLNFDLHRQDFDIHTLFGFTPTIGEDDPLQRHYHLMRRYQPFIWGVFRTEILTSALTKARPLRSPLFEELMFMNVAVLRGKAARLPVVHALRSTGPSDIPPVQRHPFFWFLHDAQSFFASYLAYRNRLAEFVRDQAIDVPTGTSLEQLLDLIHATWLGREIDLGVINHAARILLGDPIPAIPQPTFSVGWRDIEEGDVVHQSSRRSSRYIWRKSTLQQNDEVGVADEEIARVEQQLDVYDLQVPAPIKLPDSLANR